MSTIASPRRFAGHLLGVAGAAALVVVAIVGAGALLAVGIGPRTGAYRTLTVLSGSMRPAIDPGDVVVVRPVPTGHLRVGDVIAFSAPTPERPTVTHRIIEIVEPGPSPVVRTQGDDNNTPDPWQARLAPGTGWRVALVVPVIGRAINVLSRPEVRRFASIGMPVAFAVAWLAPLLQEGSYRRRRSSSSDEKEEAPAPVTAEATEERGRHAAPPRPPLRVVVAVTGACLGVGVLMAAGATARTGRSR